MNVREMSLDTFVTIIEAMGDNIKLDDRGDYQAWSCEHPEYGQLVMIIGYGKDVVAVSQR